MYPQLMEELPGNLKQRMLGALCWAIAVESALLDQQIRKEAVHPRGRPPVRRWRYRYAPVLQSPARSPTARAFEDYVRRRWPLIVFALDPVNDQQNIADSRQVGREIQLAAAFAAASGQVGVKQLSAPDEAGFQGFRHRGPEPHRHRLRPWERELRLEVHPALPESAGDSQSPTRVRGSGGSPAGARFASNLGPDRARPGELAAVVLMPSILPRICLTTNANWYRLDDPGRPLIPSDLAMEQGRRLDMLRRTLHSARDAGCYRPTDIAVMTTRIDEIESRLPMQACSVDLPYQNALGGFELFTPGATALLPELVGYEGVDASALVEEMRSFFSRGSRPEHDPGGGRREAGG